MRPLSTVALASFLVFATIAILIGFVWYENGRGWTGMLVVPPDFPTGYSFFEAGRPVVPPSLPAAAANVCDHKVESLRIFHFTPTDKTPPRIGIQNYCRVHETWVACVGRPLDNHGPSLRADGVFEEVSDLSAVRIGDLVLPVQPGHGGQAYYHKIAIVPPLDDQAILMQVLVATGVGLVHFIIGVVVWARRPRLRAARLLALLGFVVLATYVTNLAFLFEALRGIEVGFPSTVSFWLGAWIVCFTALGVVLLDLVHSLNERTRRGTIHWYFPLIAVSLLLAAGDSIYGVEDRAAALLHIPYSTVGFGAALLLLITAHAVTSTGRRTSLFRAILIVGSLTLLFSGSGNLLTNTVGAVRSIEVFLLGGVGYLIFLLAAAVRAIVTEYRRATIDERRSLKWLMVGITALATSGTLYLGFQLVPLFDTSGDLCACTPDIAVFGIVYVLPLLLPWSVKGAVDRRHWLDIDMLFPRTVAVFVGATATVMTHVFGEKLRLLIEHSISYQLPFPPTIVSQFIVGFAATAVWLRLPLHPFVAFLIAAPMRERKESVEKALNTVMAAPTPMNGIVVAAGTIADFLHCSSLVVFQRDGKGLVPIWSRGIARKALRHCTIVADAKLHKKPYFLVRDSGLTKREQKALERINGEIAMPLCENGHCLGMVVIGARSSGKEYAAGELEALRPLLSLTRLQVAAERHGR